MIIPYLSQLFFFEKIVNGNQEANLNSLSFLNCKPYFTLSPGPSSSYNGSNSFECLRIVDINYRLLDRY